LFLDDFQVYSCGRNDYIQLGLNDTTKRNKLEWISLLKEKKIIQIECGYDHSIALTGK
jgi:alpha-tubulin suppressor-like RCC1 family protein